MAARPDRRWRSWASSASARSARRRWRSGATTPRPAVRKFVDEFNNQVGKDSRDAIRHVQRELRTAWTARVAELQRSSAAAGSPPRSPPSRRARPTPVPASASRRTSSRWAWCGPASTTWGSTSAAPLRGRPVVNPPGGSRERASLAAGPARPAGRPSEPSRSSRPSRSAAAERAPARRRAPLRPRTRDAGARRPAPADPVPTGPAPAARRTAAARPRARPGAPRRGPLPGRPRGGGSRPRRAPSGRAAAGRDRRADQGRQVDAAQRAGRAGARGHRRRGVHADRHVVPGRPHLPRAGPAPRTAAAASCPPDRPGACSTSTSGGWGPATSTACWSTGRPRRCGR